MWPFAVAVLPRQTGAGDRGPLTPTGSAAVPAAPRAGGRGPVAAAVGVHPGQEVCVLCPALVEAVVAWNSTAPTAHLNQGVALGMVARHGDATGSRSLRNHLLLKRSGG